MHRLTLFMFVVVTTFEFLARGDKWGKFKLLPGAASFTAELLGAVALLYVIVLGTRSRFEFIRPAYWFVFGGLLITCLCGVVVNGVDSGPVFAGIRNFLRALPWFFIPAVFAFSEKQVRAQLWLLAGICVLQVPLSVEQRIATASNFYGFVSATGDWTIGTLMISSILSIFMICALCVLTAFWVRKQLATRHFLPLFVLFMVPTLINETKGSLVLLPIGLLATFLLAAEPGRKGRQLLVAGGLVAVFVAAYVPVYNLLVAERQYGVSIGEFLADERQVRRYLSTGGEIGTTQTAGRLDAIAVPLQELAKNPVNLAFGFGIGNASESALGKDFTGEYFDLYKPFLVNAFARIVLEMGLFGLALVFCLYWLIFADCRAVASRDDGTLGAVAAGFGGITLIMAMAVFYKDIVAHASLSFLFWYFAGLLAASRMRLARQERPAAAADRRHRLTGSKPALAGTPLVTRSVR